MSKLGDLVNWEVQVATYPRTAETAPHSCRGRVAVFRGGPDRPGPHRRLAVVAAVLALIGAGVLGGLTLDRTTLEVAGHISPWLLASLRRAAGRVLLLTRGLAYRLPDRGAFVVAVAGEFWRSARPGWAAPPCAWDSSAPTACR